MAYHRRLAAARAEGGPGLDSAGQKAPRHTEMSLTDKRKQSLYFPEDMLKEIQAEAVRQDRSLSWIVQQAWRVSRMEIKRFPSMDDVLGEAGVDKEG